MDRNIFGLHLSQDSDLAKAALMINDHGDWGWITIVIQSNDLNPNKWQRFFDDCRRLHIQPIVRLATRFENGSWMRPDRGQIDDLAHLLASLNWPSDYLPVVLFNEVNHGLEWGGSVDVKGYTDLAIYGVDKLKSLNPNFIVMGAALDLAAPEKGENYKSVENFYHEIALYKKEYFEKMDALASHSYPNPGFVGLPNDTGKMSISGYDWELQYIASLGINKKYPVYITEAGWPSRETEGVKSRYFVRQTAVDLNILALEKWQQDQRIRAVTFFTFNYPYPPFAKFSWVDREEKLYSEYEKILEIDKGSNDPKQVEKVKFENKKLPLIVFGDIALYGEIKLKNEGKSIWGENRHCFDPKPNEFQLIPLCLSEGIKVEPGSDYNFVFSFRIPKNYNKDIDLEWDQVGPIKLEQIIPNQPVYQTQITFLDKIRRKIFNWIGMLK